jgi:hypothetical protein
MLAVAVPAPLSASKASDRIPGRSAYLGSWSHFRVAACAELAHGADLGNRQPSTVTHSVTGTSKAK